MRAFCRKAGALMASDTGITERHARSCLSRTGGGCGCVPTFKAQVYDRRAGKRLTRSFATITAARQWRQDATPRCVLAP